jgi:hypothetical protein
MGSVYRQDKDVSSADDSSKDSSIFFSSLLVIGMRWHDMVNIYAALKSF